MSYASNTAVSADRSRAEIESLLMRFGASGFGYWTDHDKAMIQFVYHGIRIQFVVPLPNPKDEQFFKTPTGRVRKNTEQARQNYEQEVRRRWRTLTLAIKAKLVSVDEGVFTFEQEFMSHMVTEDGRTVAERMLPAIVKAMECNGPLLLEAK